MILRRDSDPGVSNRKPCFQQSALPFALGDRDGNASGGRELCRVADEIKENLMDPCRVGQ